MKRIQYAIYILASFLIFGFAHLCEGQQSENLTLGASARSSSERGSYHASNAIDQQVSDQSRWLSAEDDPKGWLEISFPESVDVGVVDVFSGYQDGSPVQEFNVAFKQDGQWNVPANGKIRGNQDLACRLKFSESTVDAIKISLVRRSPGRIREVAVYKTTDNPIGSGIKEESAGRTAVDRSQHQIAVNQIGYDSKFPKRFTAPLSPDGAEFLVRRVTDSKAIFRGSIESRIGDFSGLDEQGEFVIEISSGELKGATSDRFWISESIVDDVYWQGAIDFLIDSRAVVGTHPSAYGGCPWRDGTYYDAIIPALVFVLPLGYGIERIAKTAN